MAEAQAAGLGVKRCACGCRRSVASAATGRPRRYYEDACRVRAWRKRRRRSVHFSSETPEWATPQDIFDELDREFRFDLDPCATMENAKCTRYFTRVEDGLTQEWTGRVFMNPPYGGQLGHWMQKAWESSQKTAELVVCLVPARTCTAWWHDYATLGEVRFLRGRLRFGGGVNSRTPGGSAPFPSAIVVFRNAKTVTERASEEAA